MRIKEKALLYDISNLAFAIADTGEHNRHTLHRVRDICEDGNIDRVSRILGLAYANVLTVLSGILEPPKIDLRRDLSVKTRDYLIDLKKCLKISKEISLKVKETAHEYMVCMALADWLEITMPETAPVWRERANACLNVLSATASSILAGQFHGGLRRRLSPF